MVVDFVKFFYNGQTIIYTLRYLNPVKYITKYVIMINISQIFHRNSEAYASVFQEIIEGNRPIIVNRHTKLTLWILSQSFPVAKGVNIRN